MSKLTIEEQLTRFVKSGYKIGYFTDQLYGFFFIDTNGFIAHYNRKGFYAERFNDLDGLKKTIEIMRTANQNFNSPKIKSQIALFNELVGMYPHPEPRIVQTITKQYLYYNT